jgi:hypothetical protein
LGRFSDNEVEGKTKKKGFKSTSCSIETEMDLGDLMIAGDTTDKGVTRVQSLIDKNG